MQNKIIYALDFDGVICDSAIETGMTGWNVAKTIWPDMPDTTVPEALMSQFRQVRPVVETGYESILIMRLLYLGVSADELIDQYEHKLESLIQNDGLDIDALKKVFGETRDTWILNAEQEWLEMNPLFAGMPEKLLSLAGTTWYVITTKQERFVKLILQTNQIEIADERIYGLDRQLGKQEVLQIITEAHPDHEIIFVEDRLPTLLGIAGNQALDKVRLQLADWGYNTARDRDYVRNMSIELISLDQLLGDCYL